MIHLTDLLYLVIGVSAMQCFYHSTERRWEDVLLDLSTIGFVAIVLSHPQTLLP